MSGSKPRKTPKASVPKAPRQRRASDDVYNARRRAKRYVASLERDIASGKLSATAAAQARSTIKDLQSQIAGTYRKKGERNVTAEQASAANTLSERVSRFRALEVGSKADVEAARRLAVFKAEQLRAMEGDTSTSFGEYGKAKVQTFWRMTRELWAHTPNANREQEVINKLRAGGYDVSNIAEAYDLVMNRPEVDEAFMKARNRNLYFEAMRTMGIDSADVDAMNDDDLLPDEEFYPVPYTFRI